jgi:DNA polymerase IV
MIACVVIPHFAVQVEWQHDPALSDLPLVVVQYGKKKGKVLALSKEAAHRGIEVGQAISRTRALCPTVYIQTFDVQRYESAINALLITLWTFTNRIQLDETAYPQNAVFYLDLGRLREDDLHLLRDEIESAMGKTLYQGVSVSLASGKLPAYLAAIQNTPFVPRGKEEVFVASAPITLLALPKAIEHKLNVLRVCTLGEFAALSHAAVVSQFGKIGQHFHQLALGQDYHPVKPLKMPQIEHIHHDFDFPLIERERLKVVMIKMSQELALRLQNRNAALHEIVLTLHFERGKGRTEHLHLLQPITSAESIYQTLEQLVERKTLTAGIVRIEVRLAHLVSSIPRQLELFTYKPQSQELIDLAMVLSQRHGRCFYRASLAHETSLLPERRFHLKLVGS